MRYVISMDPGNTTGLALWHSDGSFIEEMQLDLEHLISWLIDFDGKVSTIIVEDFLLYKHKAQQQTGSRFQASQVIGMMKLFARQRGAKIVIQPYENMVMGSMHSGRKQPSDHKVSHKVDAYNHGFYWFVEQGILKPVLQQGK